MSPMPRPRDYADEPDLMAVREREGIFEVLTLIEERTDTNTRMEWWEPLASFIVRHRIMEMPEGTCHGLERGLTLEDALIAEGWSPPA